MNTDELKQIALAAAKNIKTQQDLSEFQRMLTKVTVEAALNAELDDHLGYDRHEKSDGTNHRNGYSNKTVQTDVGQFELETPRDRNGDFEPQLVKKDQRRFTAMDDKIYVYGYLNRVHSSRRLEREAQRNVELKWLSGRLAPDFKTIANFRKDNGEAIRLVCREFVMLCRKMNLLGDTFAIDGSKFKAVNNRDKNLTRAKMKRRLAEVEASIDRYLDELDNADQSVPPEDTRSLKDKITALTEEMGRLKKFEVRMLEAPDQQLSLTDPDARSMKSRGGGIVGYNLQTAVDVDHHLIVSHEVTNVGSDRRQLTKMAKQAKAALQTKDLKVIADAGYYNGDELRSCEDHNITAYVPHSVTSRNKARGSSIAASSTTSQRMMSINVLRVSD